MRVVTRKMRENAHFLLAREWVFFEAFEEHRDSDRTCSGALVTKLSAFISKISEWRNARMKETKEMYSSWGDDHGVRLGNVKISDLHDFKEHPFHVVEDTALFELAKSIEDKGVLVLLIVRANPYGDGYEIIAGHRRKAACKWAGLSDVPVMIVELDDNEAVIAMVDAKRLHHEIYLSDARKVAPEKWKTVIRHPIRKKQ